MRGLNIVLFMLFAFSGCAPQIGDECSSDLECGRARICDLASRAGYCTISPCEPGTCPEESTCVEFDNAETYCMATCESGDDCRTGYTCHDDAEHPRYCRQVQ